MNGGGRVLGAWPAEAISSVPADLREQSCRHGGCAYYAWMQGTSMAAPNAAGVAALIASRGVSSPDDVERSLEETATDQPCPANPFNPGPPFDFAATCDGRTGSNGFYGAGIVNALAAATA